jgi:hypothetical protein
MIFLFEAQSNPYAVVDHQAETFEEWQNLAGWLVVLLDSLEDSHAILVGRGILASTRDWTTSPNI